MTYFGIFAACIGVPALIVAMSWLAIYADECRCEHCQENGDA